MDQERHETSSRALASVVLAIFVGLLGCAKEEAPAPGAGGFATRREHAVEAKPSALLALDLDGDGRDELVVTDPEQGQLRLWKGDASWTARSARVVGVGGWPLAPVAVREPGVARPRVAVASRSRRDLAVLDLCGEVPGLELRRVDLPATPRALAAGKPFLLAVACDAGQLALIGPKGEPRVVAIPDGLPRCALVLSDGSAVVLGYQDRRSLVVVDVADPGRVEREIVLGGIPRALDEADLDGDGDLELAAAGGDGSIWVLGFGETGGSIAWRRADAPAPLEWPVGAIPIDLASADLDQDGRTELVWLAYHDLAWNVAGGFARGGPGWTVAGYAGQTPCALALLDRDGDGRLDLAIANRDSQSVSLARGLGLEGFATPVRVPVGRFPTALVAGDLDRDGHADLVVLESKDDTASILWNRGGRLERSAALATGPDPRGASLGDLDGDGRLDLALVSDDPQGSAVRLWFGGDAGALAPRPGTEGPRLAAGVRALLVSDIDGDGRADLVVADAERGEITLWRGLPGKPGTFALGPPVALAVRDGPCALAAIQLDADPALEIAVALGSPNSAGGVALLKLKDAGLREIGRLDADGPAIALAPADLDGDGLEDLAVLALPAAAAPNGEVRAFLRAGAPAGASFRPAGTFATSSHPRSIAAGDLDGDGLPDLVVPAQYAHRVDFACSRRAAGDVAWHLEAQEALGAGVGCMDAVLVDVDGDGSLDIAVANGHSDDVTILFATGR